MMLMKVKLSLILITACIPSYIYHYSSLLHTPFSHLFINLPHSPCPFPSDPLFPPTYGSLVKSVNTRYHISLAYFSIAEHLGKFEELKKVAAKLKNKGKGDGKVSAKVIDRRLYKR
jgi:hypothetical protein